MMRLVIFLSVYIFVVGCLANSNKDNLLGTLPIVEGALDVKEINLTEDSAQLYFRVLEPYPSIKTIEYYRRHLSDQGWTKCHVANSNWTQFLDSTSSPTLSVHQLLDYWTRKSDGQLMMVSATYYSSDLASETPDNDDQRIVVFVQKVAELNVELKKIGITLDSCR